MIVEVLNYFPTEEKINKFVKNFIMFGWPILVNYIGLNCLFPMLKGWDHTIAVLQYAVTPGVTLLLAVRLKQLNKSRSFPIIVALGYVVYSIYQINKWTIKQLATANLLSLLLGFKMYYLIFVGSIIISIYAI